jgi:hypothetical protein
MKHFLYALLLVLFISCTKEKTIKINGTVYDVNNIPLDSVKIKLQKTTIFYPDLFIEIVYSKKGIFEFEFTPEDMWNYSLNFEKKGYIEKKETVDRKKKKQKFNIIMEKAEE